MIERQVIILVLKVIIILIAAYLLGSVNLAVLISKFVLKQDVRDKGSGNAGATNVARVFGMKFGVVTLIGDIIKTLLAALVGHLLLGDIGEAIACLGCLFGHAWPVFFNFKGGKGIAVGAAVIAVTDWRVLIISLSIFVIVVAITKMISAGSVCAAFSFPVLLPFFGPAWYNIVMSIFAASMVIWLHRANIKRIINGTESKFSFKK
ncbi:MAG: glycerol-3-phosphate 1-O-acyltransferase PlsY [Ruminococcaceae bacterium]|nr:glycerol-3-phosphate 1-O-acyltransferase PlsY [Oscillospiraceae bacterium]